MATVTVERERRDAKSACRVAGFTLGGSSARREFGSAGAKSSTQHARDDVVDGAPGQGVDVTATGMTQRSA